MKKLKCPVPGCNQTAKGPPGLSAHIRTAHANLWKGSTKATVAAINGEEIPEVSQRTKKKKRRPYNRRPAGKKLVRGLQHAANDDGINFCPRCGYHLEIVRVANSFAAGNR
jgi:hypothetical protein